jgi:hypothetical protein
VDSAMSWKSLQIHLTKRATFMILVFMIPRPPWSLG